MKNLKRALRRHHRARMRNRARVVYLFRWGMCNSSLDPEVIEKNINQLINNIAICSCHMCGNPRKYWKQKTQQEKRADQKMLIDIIDDGQEHEE